jgi:hypothetical protein
MMRICEVRIKQNLAVKRGRNDGNVWRHEYYIVNLMVVGGSHSLKCMRTTPNLNTIYHILSILSLSHTQAKRNYQLQNLALCKRFLHKLKGFIPLHIHHLLRKVKNKPLYIPIESNLVKKVSNIHSKDISNFF